MEEIFESFQNACFQNKPTEICLEIISKLESLNFICSSCQRTLMHVACISYRLDVIQLLCQRNYWEDLSVSDCFGNTPLLYIYQGPDNVDTREKNPVVFNSRSHMILQWLLDNEYITVRKLFSFSEGRKGSFTSLGERRKESKTPLGEAIRYNNADLVAWLLSLDGSAILLQKDENGKLPIHKADRLETFQALVKYCDIKERNDEGESVLLRVCKNVEPFAGSSELIKFLLENGSDDDIHIFDKHNQLPFAYLCQLNSVRTIKILAERMSQKEILHCDTKNKNALHYACENQNSEVVGWFLSKYTKTEFPHSVENKIYCPLYLCISNGCIYSFRKFLNLNSSNEDAFFETVRNFLHTISVDMGESNSHFNSFCIDLIQFGICRRPFETKCLLDDPESFLRRRCCRMKVSKVIAHYIRRGISLNLTLFGSEHKYAGVSSSKKKCKRNQDSFAMLPIPIRHKIADFSGYSHGKEHDNLKEYISLIKSNT